MKCNSCQKQGIQGLSAGSFEALVGLVKNELSEQFENPELIIREFICPSGHFWRDVTRLKA